jgi:hypothetical protein
MTNYSVLKAVESQIRRIKVLHGEKELDHLDQALFHDVLLYAWSLLQDLLPSEVESSRQYRGFLGSSEIDVLKFSATLKLADEWIKHPFDHSTGQGGVTLECFKRTLKVAGLSYGFLRPLESVFKRFFETFDPADFRTLNTWINFPGRVNFRSLDLSEDCLLKYCTFEEGLQGISYDDALVRELNAVMVDWLYDLDMAKFLPRHGPGAVADLKGRPSALEKHCSHHMDERLSYFYKKTFDRGFDQFFPFDPSFDLDRTSEIVFVAKSMTKNRTISKEPVSLQYTQQGVQHALDEYFRDNRTLARVINLHRADLSQDLARLGSKNGEFDTLDLSDASDSVTFPLVKGIFRNTPLYRALVCTRSDRTRLPNGDVLDLVKFAPMGSSLCFPVECLVFACICEVATRRLGCKHVYRVYGDDIVCDRRLTPIVIEILSALSFTLNVSKSFYGGQNWFFREACGGEYVNNIDVAPFRVSRWLKAGDDPTLMITSTDTVQSFISFANNAFDRGLFCVRRAILLLLKRRFPHFEGILFSDDDTHLRTFSDGLTNWRLKSRFRLSSHHGNCYQRTEVKCIRSTTRRKKTSDLPDFLLANEELVRWFEYWRIRSVTDVYEGRIDGILFPHTRHRDRSNRSTSDEFSYLPELVEVRSTLAIMTWGWCYL